MIEFICLLVSLFVCLPDEEMRTRKFLVIRNPKRFFFYYNKHFHVYPYNIQSNILNELVFNVIDVNCLYYEPIIIKY